MTCKWCHVQLAFNQNTDVKACFGMSKHELVEKVNIRKWRKMEDELEAQRSQQDLQAKDRVLEGRYLRYLWYKIVFYAVRDVREAQYLSISHVDLYNQPRGGVAFEPKKITSRYGQHPNGEGPENLMEHSAKSYSDASIMLGPVELVIECGKEIPLTSYSFTTSSKPAAADPTCWVLLGSVDGEHWQTLDKRSCVKLPEKRGFQSQQFEVPQLQTGMKEHPFWSRKFDTVEAKRKFTADFATEANNLEIETIKVIAKIQGMLQSKKGPTISKKNVTANAEKKELLKERQKSLIKANKAKVVEPKPPTTAHQHPRAWKHGGVSTYLPPGEMSRATWSENLRVHNLGRNKGVSAPVSPGMAPIRATRPSTARPRQGSSAGAEKGESSTRTPRPQTARRPRTTF